jgi:hypothetical protein
MSESLKGMTARLKAASVNNVAGAPRVVKKTLAMLRQERRLREQEINKLQQNLQAAEAVGNVAESERIESLLETTYGIPRRAPPSISVMEAQDESPAEAEVESDSEVQVEPAVKSRDPAKQARIEATLQSVKRSKSYPDIESKIITGIYRTNRTSRNRNRNFLLKTKTRLTEKLEKEKSGQLKGDIAKIAKIDTLLPIIEDETNVENERDVNNADTNESAYEETVLAPVAQEAPLANQGVAPAPAIMQEMLEAENAVEAVRNVEHALALQGEGEKVEATIQMESDCIQLYDPCTKEPIANIQELERRIRELKRKENITPVGLYGLTNDTTIYDFLTTVFVDQTVSLDDMVSFKLSAGRAKPGTDIFEVLSRLFVFFGGIEDVNPTDQGNYKFMNRIEGGSIYPDASTAFQSMKCIASKGSGVSDITLVRSGLDRSTVKLDDAYCEVECSTPDVAGIQTYLMSVKWYTDEKNAEHYDLEKLYVAGEKATSHEQRPIGIIVFLKSKRDFQIAHSRSYRQYTSDLANTFFGWEENVKPFLEDIRKVIFEAASIKGISPKDTLLSQYFLPNSKPVLSLQLHQDIIVTGLCDQLENNQDKNFLVGVLPRGGKTFIAGGIIREHLQRTQQDAMNILWLTAAPNETIKQVSDELLDRFQDFADFEFVEVKQRKEFKKNKKYTVFFSSTQLIVIESKKAGGRQFLSDLLTGKSGMGLVFFDEAHKTGTGLQTKQEIDSIINNYTGLPFIFLTATYFNILIDFQIQKQNTYIWDYTDVLKTRGLATETEQDAALENLRARFGEELVNMVIDKRLSYGETIKTMGKAYVGFPDLYFISAEFQEEIKERFEAQSTYRPDSGFSMDTIFAIQPTTKIHDIKTPDNKVREDAYKVFINLENPQNINSLLTPFSAEDEGECGKPLIKEPGLSLEPTILGRINKMSIDANSRFRLDERPTLLMFMPTGGMGSNIFYLICAWASFLMKCKWWRERYEVACVVSDEGYIHDEALAVQEVQTGSNNIHVIDKNTKSSLLQLERQLHCEKNKGLIILAGERLSMGISLPCVDVVCLFNQKKSPDDIIQKMYRALTPSINKKAAFVVDLNPIRSLSAVYNYTRASHEKANSSKEILDIIYDTYSWDADWFDMNIRRGAEASPLTFQKRLQDMYELAQHDPSKELRINENIGGYEKRLRTNIRTHMTEPFLTDVMAQVAPQKVAKMKDALGLKQDAKFAIDKTGRLIITKKVERPADEDAKVDEGAEPTQEEVVELVIDNFSETVADFIKYLVLTTNSSTLDEALAEYEENVVNAMGSSLRQNVINMLRARTQIKEGSDTTILPKLMLEAVKNFARTSSEAIYRQMKGKINEPSRKNKVLQIIHRHLTPRKKQKEEKGEVFTPVELVESMLSHLPKSVWSNPDLVWLDPANGIGNFPVVAFYKLDEGLREWEPNDNKRRKHIIENMLYMLEIQSGNSRIARNIFEKLCDKCKPNILTVNSLDMTSEKLKQKGFPEKYDIIMGNPPFNAGGLLARQPYWVKFIKLAFDLINENGYITYVHPPGWRKFYDPEDKENKGKILYDIREKGWNIEYLNISDTPPAHFPIVDYYVIHAKKSTKPTSYDSKFMDITSKGITSLDYPFIPNMLNDETFSILDKLLKADGLELDIKRTGGKNGYEPSSKDIGKPGIQHYHYTDKTGKKIFYGRDYDDIPEYINTPKVILTFSNGYEKGKLFAFYSDEKIGVTRTALYIIVKSKAEGEKLVKFLNSDIITFLMKITQYDQAPYQKNEYKILNLLKVPDSLDYGLTKKEEELIKKIVHSGEKADDDAPKEGGRKKINKTRKIRR